MKNKSNPKLIYYIYNGTGSLLFSLVFTSITVYYINKIGLNPLELVLIGTTLEVTCFLFEIPTGIIADLYSRKLSIIIGVFLIGLGFLLEGLVPLFVFVLIAQLLWGIGATFTSGAESAWIADETDQQDIDHTYLRGAQVAQVFAFVGIIASIFLATISLNLPIVIGGASFILLAFFLIFFMPETKFKSSVPEELHLFKKFTHTFTSGLKVIKGNKVLKFILIISLFYGLSSEGFDRLWQAYFMNEINFPDYINLKPVTLFGMINGLSMLFSLITTHFMIEKINKDGKLENITILLVINFLLIVSFILFGLAGQFYYALVVYLSIYIFRTVNRPIFNAWMNKQISGNTRATILSMNAQVDAFGQIAGGPIMGLIASKLTIGISMVFTGVLLIPILPIYYKIKKYKNRNVIENENNHIA